MTEPPYRLVGTSDVQTLTNKTVVGTDNPGLQIFPLNVDHGSNASAATFFRGDGGWHPLPEAPTASHITDVLSSDVSLPFATLTMCLQVAQGTTGTWLALASITLADSSGSGGTFTAQLSDGTTIIDSTEVTVSATAPVGSCTLTGVVVNPTGNIRVAAVAGVGVTGLVAANYSSFGKDSVLTAVQLL